MSKREARTSLKGWAPNPLMQLPRNMQCPCKSGKKWKACCLPLTKPYVLEINAHAYHEAKCAALSGDWAW